MSSVRLAALSLLALAAAAPAAAQQSPIANPRGMVANFDIANVGAVFDELGVAWQAQTMPNGEKFVTASYNDLNFNFMPAACNPSTKATCVGGHFVALFDVNANPQTVSAFNQRYVFASGGVLSNGSTYLSRYDIADFGIPRGNFASSVATFLYLSEQFMAAIATGAKTVSLDGYADDTTADLMNRQGAAALGVAPHSQQSTAALHESAVAATPVLVQMLRDAKAPTNKIRNPAQ